MLLPIGHDSGTVRRNPWVTYAIMAACLGIFVYTNSMQHEIVKRHLEGVHEAVRFFVEHPYLEPPSELERYLGPDWEVERAALVEALKANGMVMLPPSLAEPKQEELDAMVAEAMAVRASHPFFRWGLIPSQPTVEGAFGYMFLHGGWMHLLGNMLLLFLTAPFIEDKWGRPVFAVFFLMAGLAGAGLWMSRFPSLATPLVGASGAVAGCMGAFLVRFWRARLRYLAWFVLFGFTFSAPAWLMLPLWFAGELLYASVSEAVNPVGGGGVAYWAHVGGFVFGASVAVALRVLHIEERWMDSVVDRKIGAVSNEGVEAAMQAHEEGRAEDALVQLQQETRRNPKNREAAQALWDVAHSLGRAAEAAPVLMRLIREELRANEPELAVQHWMEFSQAHGRLPVDPVVALRLAGELAEKGHPSVAVDALRRGLESPDANPTIALRLARAARELDKDLSAEAARRALLGVAPAEVAEARSLLEALGAPETLPEPEPPDDVFHPQPDELPELAEPSPAPVEPVEADAGLSDADLDGLDLSDVDLDDLDLEGEGLEAAAPETQIAAPPIPEVADDSRPEWSAGQEPGTFDPDALSAEVSPELDGAGGGSWGDVALADEPSQGDVAVLRPLRVMDAVPVTLREDALSLDVDGRGKTRLRFDKVDAVAAAAVHMPGRERPVLLVDLALNFTTGADSPLQVVRLRSDRFDPRRVVEGASKPLDALRGLVEAFLDRCPATALPDRETVCGRPRFAVHADLATYEREVLLADASLDR